MESPNYRSIFLSCLGSIHLIAFWSYYTQFPGLLSASGIEPVERLMPYAAPFLYENLVQTELLDSDTLCELFAILGITISCLITSGKVQHASLFIVLGSAYRVLVRSGGTFYSFQWDALLLETTAISALCYAPWRHRLVKDQSPVGAWPLRVLLFKLMYMSGVVKIQADCPTWENLTALEYHFATQCLPGPLAWHAHQMHPFLLRLSVALTLWIEIPASLLLIGFTDNQRRVGATLQACLQLVILLTGNYTFFNILTLALCLPCLERDRQSSKKQQFKTVTSNVLAFVYLSFSFHRMFTFYIFDDTSWWRSLNVKLALTKAHCNQISEVMVPVVAVFLSTVVIFKAIHSFRSRQAILTPIHAFICLTTIGIVLVPMCDLTPRLRSGGFIGLKKIFRPLHAQYARKYMISNGYGLFRQMTGVGEVPDIEGWAGLPPSVVARPEIILEGVFHGGNSSEEVWHELQFRWKPGDVRKMPLQVAPHQPRLDWQMWFAALGAYNNNPWFINMVKKMLDDCTAVMHLIGDPKLLSRTQKLIKMRAKLYSYDFTRFESEWTKSLPDVELIKKSRNTLVSDMTLSAQPYWKRKFIRLYMPTFEQGDASLIQFVDTQGYTGANHGGCRGTGHSDRCMYSSGPWCWIAAGIRLYRLHRVIIGLLALHLLLVLQRVLLAGPEAELRPHLEEANESELAGTKKDD